MSWKRTFWNLIKFICVLYQRMWCQRKWAPSDSDIIIFISTPSHYFRESQKDYSFWKLANGNCQRGRTWPRLFSVDHGWVYSWTSHVWRQWAWWQLYICGGSHWKSFNGFLQCIVGVTWPTLRAGAYFTTYKLVE